MNRDDVLKVYEGLVAPHDNIKIKGAKSAYTAINGNMFSFVDADAQMCFRYSETDKAAFNAEHGTSDVIQYNSVMRGYVTIPVALLKNEPKLKALFAASVEYARSLKPKPTKKPKA